MPIAFSVHNFISSVGADAGFAAIIGLAVLILLYFAHARETANLREEASILAERLQQAEAKVAELLRPAPVNAPVPAGEGVHLTDRRGFDGAPFAPAGVGAPALAAATRVVPLPEPAPAAPLTPAPAPALAMAGAAAAPSRTAAPSSAPAFGVPPSPSPSPSPAPTASPSPAPASPAPAPVPAPRPVIPAPATAAGANGGGRGAAAGGGPSRGPSPAGAIPPRSLPPLDSPASGSSSAGRRIAIGLAALVLLGVVAVALVILTRSPSSPKVAPPSRTTNAPAVTRPPSFVPSTVTVAVLNGTATNQLAHRVAAKLASSGYKEGRVATAANQTETSTVVAYLPGAKNRIDALHVATALNLKPTAVAPIDQATQQVACPPPGPCTANVVVTVGQDLATL